MANEDAAICKPFRRVSAKVPMLKVEPDPRACMEKGVNLREFADTLQIYQGSLYVNDFNLFGRTWQVIVQAEQGFRDQVEDIPKLEIRNTSGTMVPLGSLATHSRDQRSAGADALQHVYGGDDQWRWPAGRQLARGDRRHGDDWPDASCRSRWLTNGPRWRFSN